MHRSHRRLAAVVTALLMFLGAVFVQSIAAAPADAGRPRPPSTTTTTAPNPGFYSFGLSWSGWNQPSYVIRDGGALPFASGSHGPFYDFYGYTTNTVYAQSINGFTGTISLTVGNLPAGVTIEQLPPTITLASGQSSSVSLRVRVASTVPLGTTVSGVTITGSSGGVTSTATIPTFTVVDPLPCSTYWGGSPCYG